MQQKHDIDERIITLDYNKKDITEKVKPSTDPEDISDYLHAGGSTFVL